MWCRISVLLQLHSQTWSISLASDLGQCCQSTVHTQWSVLCTYISCINNGLCVWATVMYNLVYLDGTLACTPLKIWPSYLTYCRSCISVLTASEMCTSSSEFGMHTSSVPVSLKCVVRSYREDSTEISPLFPTAVDEPMLFI